MKIIFTEEDLKDLMLAHVQHLKNPDGGRIKVVYNSMHWAKLFTEETPSGSRIVGEVTIP